MAAVKCCTYFPFLPNFTLGALLASPRAPLIENVLARGVVTPLGLFEPAIFAHARERLGEAGFGKSTELACPFLGRGACRIWTHRPGVCASYFCRPANDVGRARLEAKLNAFEWWLAHEVLHREGFTADETTGMESARARGEPERAWYDFRGRELEMFARLWQRAQEVTPAEVRLALASIERLELAR